MNQDTPKTLAGRHCKLLRRGKQHIEQDVFLVSQPYWRRFNCTYYPLIIPFFGATCNDPDTYTSTLSNYTDLHSPSVHGNTRLSSARGISAKTRHLNPCPTFNFTRRPRSPSPVTFDPHHHERSHVSHAPSNIRRPWPATFDVHR